MERLIRLNRALNSEAKYYGLKATGLLVASVLGFLVMIKFDFTFGIIASGVGYFFGASISMFWHKGYLQKWCYWNLPLLISAKRGSKNMPTSCIRVFM